LGHSVDVFTEQSVNPNTNELFVDIFLLPVMFTFRHIRPPFQVVHSPPSD